MFGIKIIKNSEYKELVRIKAIAEERIQKVIEGRRMVEKDCESLRQQNSDLRKEIQKCLNVQSTSDSKLKTEVRKLRQFKKDVMEALGTTDLSGFRITLCESKCTDCDHEQPGCRKYTFGKTDFCALPK